MKVIKWIILTLFIIIGLFLSLFTMFCILETGIKYKIISIIFTWALIQIPFQLKIMEWLKNFNDWFNSKLK